VSAGGAATQTRTLPNGSTVAQSAGTVHLTGVAVTGAPASGFDLHGGSYHLDRLTAQETGDIGSAVTGAALLRYGTLTATYTSKTASPHCGRVRAGASAVRPLRAPAPGAGG